MTNDKNNKFTLPSANVSFPSQSDPFELKRTNEWGLNLAQQIQSEWFYGFNTGNFLNSQFNTQRRDFLERRIYAKGLQSMDKYMAEFKPDGDKSFLNLSKQPICVIPKLVNIVVNGMCDRGYSMRATSIDPIGYSERVAYREQIETDRLTKDIIIKAKETFGVDVGSMPVEQLPETDEELNLHMQLEYKQSIEISQELAIEEVFAENRFNDKIDRMVKKDLVICGISWVKNRFVKDKGILIEYVNPENKIQSYSEDPYFEDCFYHGEFKTVPLTEVYTDYQWVNSPENIKIKDQIANSSSTWWDYNLTQDIDRIKGTANLLYFTYKTTRQISKKIKNKATGERRVMSFEHKGDPETNPNISVTVIEEEVLMEGVLVLGTDILLKWEVSECMARPKSNKQKVVEQYVGMAPNMERGYIDSPVARMMPVEDKLNVLELKAEQIIQKIKPDGYIIDPDAIAELDFGNGNKLTVQNMVDMFEQTGSIFARSFGSNGDPMYSKPITELRTGDSLGKLNSLIALKMGYMDQLRDVIGLNSASDASTPDKDSLVGVQKLAALSSNIATRHILDGACDITKRTAEAITYRIHDLLKFSELKDDFARKIGVTSVKTLESIKDLHLHDFAIYLDLHLDLEERAKLENDMSIAIEKGMLSIQDKYKVLNVKNFKLALSYMTILVDKYQKKIQEQKLQEFKAQSDANAQSAERAEAARQQTAQMVGQIDMQLQQMTTQGELQKEQLRGEQDRMTLEMKINGDMSIAQLNGQVAMNKFEDLEDRKDQRSRMQASQQSQLITQRQRDEDPKDFEEENLTEDIFKL
jgi:hypothetical protein